MNLSRQHFIAVIVGLIVLTLVTYGIWLSTRNSDPYKDLVTQIPIELDEATREYFEQRLATGLAAIQAAEASDDKVNPSLYLGAASDAYSLGDLATARQMLEKQLEANSLNYVAWNNYAIVLEKMGDYQNAEDAFKKTLELEPSIQKYSSDYAKFLLEHYPERTADLKTIYENDLARRGQTVWNMLGLGDWYAVAGECVKAVDHYEVAVVLEPQNQAIKDDLATLKRTCKE